MRPPTEGARPRWPGPDATIAALAEAARNTRRAACRGTRRPSATGSPPSRPGARRAPKPGARSCARSATRSRPTSPPPRISRDLDETVDAALRFIEEGKLEEIETAARHILDRYPDIPDGWEFLGHVHDKRGENRGGRRLLSARAGDHRPRAGRLRPGVHATVRRPDRQTRSAAGPLIPAPRSRSPMARATSASPTMISRPPPRPQTA